MKYRAAFERKAVRYLAAPIAKWSHRGKSTGSAFAVWSAHTTAISGIEEQGEEQTQALGKNTFRAGSIEPDLEAGICKLG